jgi:hypothetical protein
LHFPPSSVAITGIRAVQEELKLAEKRISRLWFCVGVSFS